MADANTLDKEISLDCALDDIPDLKGFVQLHSGSYVFVAEKGIEEREINDKHYFAVDLTVKDVLEISEKPTDGEKVPGVGDVQSFLWDRQHAVAMGNFKNFIRPIAERFGCGTVRECLENSKGLELMGTGKRTYNKDKDLYNFNLKAVQVV